ncbi:MAG: 5-oxoprolinase subunit PxpB [Acidobacteriales bacterium]|nr:5-oxoprolinase subunit PxpB [Terriglobales bacterium]
MLTPARGIVRFQPASDQSLIIYFGDEITIAAHQQVIRLLRLLETEPVAGIRNLNPGYCSLLISFDGLHLQHSDVEEILRPYIQRLDEVRLPEPRKVEIPVCYGNEYGPDLNDVAAFHGMTAEQVVNLHASVIYVVYFLGFVPGFAYLGGLRKELSTPRLPAPRPRVPRGSVGIAGEQTGVYPLATPGGWRLIGQTPIDMFRPEREEMSVLKIGDQVRFMPISPDKFAALKSQ